MKTNHTWYKLFGLLIASAVTLFFYGAAYLLAKTGLYVLCLLVFAGIGAAACRMLLANKGREKKAAALRAAAGGIVFAGCMAAVPLIADASALFGRFTKNAVFAAAVFALAASLFSVLRLKRITKERLFFKPFIGILLSICVAASSVLIFTPGTLAALGRRSRVSTPAMISQSGKTKTTLAANADLFISPDGSDENDGSFARPLATLEKARDLVRKMDKSGRSGITVALKAGSYAVKQIEFSAADSGTESCPITYCAYGDGDVTLNGGKEIDVSLFSAVKDTAAQTRFSSDAAKHILCADLTKLGLTEADWGKIYPTGSYSSASHYDGDTTGPAPCALYFNGELLTIARYPNSGYLKVTDVVREGEGRESSVSNHAQRKDWDTLRNPETTIFNIDADTAERMNTYASLDDVWLWTALIYNWADATAPLKRFDYDRRTLEPAYVSYFGAVPDSDYYIFNVPEELDSPGEWYLDRETGMLYLYPPQETYNAHVMLSLTTENLITVTDAAYLRFQGLSVCGTRGDGLIVRGDHNTIENCVISDLSGTGVTIDGSRNLITGCELAHIGGSAVQVSGGERESLTPAENTVENCRIHDFSETALTAGQGVNIKGTGSVCARNEFYNAPQQAILYSGNDHVIEYNTIHDAALLSDDCSAIYSGRRWDCCGSVLRYNVLYNLGDDAHSPNGIYWDDGVSGQTAYGNLILNCKGSGFLIGGGRDHNVYNNILINCRTPFTYDDRSREGVLDPEFWFSHSREGEDMQKELLDSPWQSARWQNAYPYMKRWALDYGDTENPGFVPNPSGSRVRGNLIVHSAAEIGDFSESVTRFSDVSGNAVYYPSAMNKLFTDPDTGDYTLRADAPVFDSIPDFKPVEWK